MFKLINEWTDKWMRWWMQEYITWHMDYWLHEWGMRGWTNEYMANWISEQIKLWWIGCVNVSMDEYMNVLVNEWMRWWIKRECIKDWMN